MNANDTSRGESAEESARLPGEPGARRSSVLIYAISAVILILACSAGLWVLQSNRQSKIELRAHEQIKSAGGISILGADKKHISTVTLMGVDDRERLKQVIDSIAKLESVVTIVLSDSAIEDDDLRRLAEADSLQSLSLNNTRVTNEGVKHLTALTDLETLYLADNDIDAKCLGDIAKMQAITILDLSATRIAGDLQQLNRLQNLEWLQLREVTLEAGALKGLAGCPKLQRLNLKNSRFEASDLQELQSKSSGLNVEQ